MRHQKTSSLLVAASIGAVFGVVTTLAFAAAAASSWGSLGLRAPQWAEVPLARLQAGLAKPVAGANLSPQAALCSSKQRSDSSIQRQDGKRESCRSQLQTPLGRRKLNCGCGWQEEYSALHHRVESGQAPRRYLATYCIEGLADCFKGASTMLYYAMLTGRALKIVVPKSRLDWALDSPYINWTLPWSHEEILANKTGMSSMVHLENFQQAGWDNMYMWMQQDLRQHAEQYNNVELIYWGYCYPAGVRALALNPHHRDQLQGMGLSADTMIGCALDFLFQPNAAVLQEVAPELKILQDASLLKIGIQIRHGDGFISVESQSWMLDQYSSVFKCAEEIKAWGLTPHRKPLFYLISDNLELRKQAKKRYGAAILTAVDNVTVRHVSALKHWDEASEKGKDEVRKKGLISAVGEMWLFGFTDYQVTTKWSGYGSMGALWGHSAHSQYIVEANDWRKMDPSYNSTHGIDRKCGLHDDDAPKLWLE